MTTLSDPPAAPAVTGPRSHLERKPLRLQGPDLGYHQNWYAVALSTDVARGRCWAGTSSAGG
jgi:hypothetical protein